MTARFAPLDGEECGAWLAALLEGDLTAQPNPATGLPYDALAEFVPRGYDAVVRVLHPWRRDRPTTGEWAEYYRAWRGPDGSGLPVPEIITEHGVRWADVAGVFGTTLAADTWGEDLLGPRPWGAEPAGVETDSKIAASGWRYSRPEEGNLEPAVLSAVARVLAEHTATPGEGVAAVWEGAAQHLSPSSGTNSAHRMPLLALPERRHLCFAAGIDAFTDIPETSDADQPWPFAPQSPSVLWPAGREWVLATEVDLDSTLIACSEECAKEIIAAPGIEAVRITRDTRIGRK